MTKSIRFQFAPVEINSYSSFIESNINNKNPFVKVGDSVKLHSRKGAFRVIEIDNNFFVVSFVKTRFFIKTVVELRCSWVDFRGWVKK